MTEVSADFLRYYGEESAETSVTDPRTRLALAYFFCVVAYLGFAFEIILLVSRVHFII